MNVEGRVVSDKPLNFEDFANKYGDVVSCHTDLWKGFIG